MGEEGKVVLRTAQVAEVINGFDGGCDPSNESTEKENPLVVGSDERIDKVCASTGDGEFGCKCCNNPLDDVDGGRFDSDSFEWNREICVVFRFLKG